MPLLNISYLAIYAKAHEADYFTPGSNSSTQMARLSKAPLFIIDFDNALECLAKDLKTKQAAFL